jgi:uncharacterized protein YecE (DUF72 family)
MKFGKTDRKPEEIDFTLPEFDIKRILSTSGKSDLKVYSGQPVWSSKGNIGKIYPPKTPPSKFLYYYSRQFNSIELNATYYKIPSQKQVLKWKEQCPSDFKFCPKFTQFLSNRKNLSEKSEAIDEFLRHVYLFEENLGISFLQLPPHFSPEGLSELKKFIELLPEDMQFAVEFRHPDWFIDKKSRSSILDFMSKRNISLIITDTPGRRDVLHSDIISDNLIIRFKGNNLHQSDFDRVNSWSKNCIEFLKNGVSNLYFFVHQEDESLGIELSQLFISNLNAELKSNFRSPEFLKNQGSLFH